MHLPGPPRHKRARRQPRPSNFRPLSSLFSTAALRPNRGAARLLATCLFSYLLFLNLTSGMAGLSLRRAPSRGSAPASSGPHSSWSTSRSRGRFTVSTHETVTSRRPRGGPPLTRVSVCELPIFPSLPFLLRLNSSKFQGAPSCPVSLCILQAP